MRLLRKRRTRIMEWFCGYLILMLVGARGAPPVEELVRAKNRSPGELPSWYPSTRCSAGVHHTTPPTTETTMLSTEPEPEYEPEQPRPTENDGDEEPPTDEAVANADENAIQDTTVVTEAPHVVLSKTTARTRAEYRAPDKVTSPALYIDDE